MFTLVLENERGEQLELTHNELYDVYNIEGLSPPSANISTSPIASMDGERYNNSRVNVRNLVIYINIKSPVEDNRQALYKFFRSKRKVKVYFKNANRDVYIQGYLETFEDNFFEQLQTAQISIICPEPFFKALNEMVVEFSKTISLFEFPFDIEKSGIEFSRIDRETTQYINVGDVEVGGIFELTALKTYVAYLTIYNFTNETYFSVNESLNEGDKIIINTNRGEKSLILIRKGSAPISIIQKRQAGSEWIQFVPGDNEISYDCKVGTEYLSVSVTVSHKYEGV